MKSYGFLIERQNRHGTEYLIARAMCRENGEGHPINPDTHGESSYDERVPRRHRGRFYAGLGMHGHVYDGADGPRVIGFEPDYRDLYALGEREIESMLRTMRRVNKGLHADAVRDVGDVLFSAAKTLGFDWCVEKRDSNTNPAGWGYAADSWYWMAVGDGRNRVRALAEQMEKEAREGVAA